jgi:indolepyruvate ferredoxin oxidoreductase
MAYKDEYEVARLMLLGHSARHNGHCGMTGSWKLHPPMLRSLGMRRKLSMPFWTAPAFRVLAAGRRVRGTPVDLFGHTRLRRLERSLITEYEALIDEAVELARNGEATRAASLLAAADLVRGFEDVKLANIDRYHDEVTRIRGLDAALAASSGPDR